VIVTTRFPVDAAARYAGEADYATFRDRLQIHGLDLRHTPSVEIFARALRQRLPLDDLPTLREREASASKRDELQQ
jgi:hypothetical protein